MTRARAKAGAAARGALLVLMFHVAAFAAAELPGTQVLEWAEEDLSVRMMEGAHVFVERKITDEATKRAGLWAREVASAGTDASFAAKKRERLRTIIGAVDPRLPPAMERYGEGAMPGLVAETTMFRMWQVRWPVLEGVWGVGLHVEPKEAAAASAVVVPDASETPEQVLEREGVRRLADAGVELVIPVTVSRAKLVTEDAQLKRSDQTYREWIYRQAYHMGRHVIGYEVQVVQAAVDWLRARQGGAAKVGVAGYGEGGLVAFYTAAIDERIAAALVSGYFGPREKIWAEPIYRNVWGLLREFGDAEIAGLVRPRTLLIEHCAAPEVTGHKGEVRTPELASVQAELGRVLSSAGGAKLELFAGAGGARDEPYAPAAVLALGLALGARERLAVSSATERLSDRRAGFDANERHTRFVREVEAHVQTLVRRAEAVREKNFLLAVMPELGESRWSTGRRHPTHAPEKFVRGAAAFRERFQVEAMGRFDEPLLPPNARSRKIAESAAWTAYDVVLDVFPELFAWGMLVVPKDLKPGERRPVVVCQHGRNGLPRELLDKEPSGYNRAAAVLAERGFVTFAPHNLYRGEDRYRWLNRKANTVQATLFSFIIPQHEQILRWLGTQPFVDPKRIGFYGLSYGGETAMRVPTVLEGYALAICSGDFNQWTRKVASTEEPFSFMRTIEWEMPYWNLGHTFDYAEMAYLMVPRPFMVERGHHDRVGRDQWVAYEFAKVRWLYAQLGLAERAEIEFFQGGHAMNLEGAARFLHRHLDWPERGVNGR